ncbi:hypothetical protein H4S06_001750 [Coemansia sp. BCRC 34490]|nr:hypothetical protein H4S06_001750 [Coemansia sp. BCRC 34490]
MADNTFLASMAAHACYVPNNINNISSGSSNEAAYVSLHAQQQKQQQQHASAVSAIVPGFVAERRHVPKRGRSYEETDDASDHQMVNEMQRCTYYRKTIVPIGAKRAKPIETHV